jgi:hypothetical protein
MTTMLIELTHQKAADLLRDLEQLAVIRVLSQEETSTPKRSAKYRGILSREQGEQLQAHIGQMRSEWETI